MNAAGRKRSPAHRTEMVARAGRRAERRSRADAAAVSAAERVLAHQEAVRRLASIGINHIGKPR